jgi:hypothetical protein
VRVAGRSVAAPGLPLITAPAFAHHVGDIHEAMRTAIAQLPADSRAALGVAHLVPASAADYEQLKHPPFGLISVIP